MLETVLLFCHNKCLCHESFSFLFYNLTHDFICFSPFGRTLIFTFYHSIPHFICKNKIFAIFFFLFGETDKAVCFEVADKAKNIL